MARTQTRLEGHLEPDELRRRYRSCPDSKDARRWHALWLLSQGQKAAAVAQTLGMSAAWVRRVRQRYNTHGPQRVPGGHRQRPGGRPPRLTPGQQRRLQRCLQQLPPDGGLWTGTKVATWITEQTGKKAHPQLGCVYLHRLGWSLQVPRRRHTRTASPAQQQAFKKSFAAGSPPSGDVLPGEESKCGRTTKRDGG